MLCCPSCGSREIYPAAGGYIGPVYVCHVCGYRGPLVVEVDEESERDGD